MKASSAQSKHEATRRMNAPNTPDLAQKHPVLPSPQHPARPVKSGTSKARPSSSTAERPIIGKNIGAPTNFSHDTHVGWDGERGFEVRNIPAEWKRLFQSAGVTRSEIEDPNTRKMIMNAVRASMFTEPNNSVAPQRSSSVGGLGDGPRAVAPPPPAPTGGPPPPTGGPPAPSNGPPTFIKTQTQTTAKYKQGQTLKAKWSGDGQFYTAVIQKIREDGVTKYYTVTFTEYAESEEVTEESLQSPEGSSAPPAPPSGGLFAELSKKKDALKPVDLTATPDIADIGEERTEDLVNSIQKALQARRAGLMSAYGQGATAVEDGDDWEDEDDSWMDN